QRTANPGYRTLRDQRHDAARYDERAVSGDAAEPACAALQADAPSRHQRAADVLFDRRQGRTEAEGIGRDAAAEPGRCRQRATSATARRTQDGAGRLSDTSSAGWRTRRPVHDDDAGTRTPGGSEPDNPGTGQPSDPAVEPPGHR